MAKEIATFAGGCFWCMIKPFDTHQELNLSLQVIQGDIRKILLIKKFVQEKQDIQKLYKLPLIQKSSLMNN